MRSSGLVLFACAGLLLVSIYSIPTEFVLQGHGNLGHVFTKAGHRIGRTTCSMLKYTSSAYHVFDG